MSDDRKDIFIDRKAVEAVDAKINESKRLTSGMISSWSNPLEGATEGPKGKITPPRKVEHESPSLQVSPKSAAVGFVKVPMQAMGTFKKLLPMLEGVEVKLTLEQKGMFLNTLQEMPTPKKMMDAKAIFELMEALAK